MTTPITVRRASAADADGINAIYNPVIRSSPATFEMTEISASDRVAWLEGLARSPRTPVFVAADARNTITGFANAAPFDPRGAYETSVKVSVFVDPSSQGSGVARRLYQVLFDALAGTDAHRAYALIVAPNPASEALHAAFGFRHVATLSEVGRKFGRFWDVKWFEKPL